jgi:hypothetical protein
VKNACISGVNLAGDLKYWILGEPIRWCVRRRGWEDRTFKAWMEYRAVASSPDSKPRRARVLIALYNRSV